jgi:hypothetical protein
MFKAVAGAERHASPPDGGRLPRSSGLRLRLLARRRFKAPAAAQPIEIVKTES